MRKEKNSMARFFSASTSIRRRIFLMLILVGFGSFFVVNLIWLPGEIHEIKEFQSELRQTSIRLFRDRIQEQFAGEEASLKNTAMRMRPYFIERDRERLRLLAQQRLQSDPEFEEIGILDESGRELVRVARRTAITDADLIDRSATPLFRDGVGHEIRWQRVDIASNAEPLVTLTSHIPGSGLVFGTINLKLVLSLVHEFKLNYDGRAYIVDETGRLLAAADPSLVLRQLSFADRPLIRRLLKQETAAEGEIDDAYVNEAGQRRIATGRRFARPAWALVIDQSQSLLFSPILEQIWFFAGLCLFGLFATWLLARSLSRRFTRPIVRLREGAEQIGSGNLDYRVAVATADEIGELANQFNLMAERLRAAQQATLSALTMPIISQTSELGGVVNEVLIKIMNLTGAEAGSIRLVDDDARGFVFSVYQGFAENFLRERPTVVSEEIAATSTLEASQPLITGNLGDDALSPRSPLLNEGFHSAVFLPLRTPEKIFGIMTLANRSAGHFSSKQEELFAAIAHQIAIALQSAGLFKDTERNLERIGALHGIVSATVSSLNLRSVLELLLEKITTILPYDAATVQLRDRSTGRLEQTACRNIEDEDWAACSGGVLDSSAAERAPVIVSDSRTDRRTSDSDFLRRQHLIAFVQLPLVAKNEILGVITFFKKEAHEFTGEEVEFLSTLAGQAAIAICNAQLYEHSARQALELEKASKLQADFSAMIVHDLRSPLSTIMSIAEMINGGMLGDVNDEQKQWLDRLRHNASDLVRLVSDFLDLSKLEAGRVELSRAPTQIPDLLRNTVENFAPLARTKNISLTVHTDETLPAVSADARRLDQVLNNLVSNALKFTAAGGSIRLEARADGAGVLVVKVQDSGVGIAQEEIPKLFQKYRQTASGNLSAQKGTGLGLVICKMIIEAHGGSIWAQSEEGKGATFSFKLPMSECGANGARGEARAE
jgi:signal transduction histidine kinase